LRLEPPGPRLRRELMRETGIDPGEEACERAFRAEIQHYVAHHVSAADREGLERLRDGCAAVVAAELGAVAPAQEVVRRAMVAAIEFTAFDDAAPSLRLLRGAGHKLVAVSNWDCSLPDVLVRAGLDSLIDGVSTSAEAGAAKPAPEPFRRALEIAGCEPAEAVMVGDSQEHDIEGAEALGIAAILLRRGPAADAPGPRVIRSLRDLPSVI
jgi:HAD superfamily hydrolase (TIGR01549 family)